MSGLRVSADEWAAERSLVTGELSQSDQPNGTSCASGSDHIKFAASATAEGVTLVSVDGQRHSVTLHRLLVADGSVQQLDPLTVDIKGDVALVLSISGLTMDVADAPRRGLLAC